MPSVISNSFICLSLGICLFPHCFIEVAGASRTMLNKSGERGHSSLVPNLGGKSLSLLTLSMVLQRVGHD